MAEPTSIFGVIALALTLYFGYLSKKHGLLIEEKLKSKELVIKDMEERYAAKINDLKNLIADRDELIKRSEVVCQDRIHSLESHYKEASTRQQQQITDMEERSAQYRETIKVMSREMAAKTLADLRTKAEIQKLRGKMKDGE